jgi:hypothetical protein
LSRGTLEHVTSPRRARSLLGSSDLLRTLYACQRAPSRTFRRAARVSACGCPDLPSSGFFWVPDSRSLGVDPLQSLHVSRPSDPLGPDADSHEVPCPYDGIPRASPHATGRSAPIAVRSRVFSTPQRFASTPGLRGLVSCRSHPWGSSLRSVPPRRGRVPLSGPPLLPCGCRPTSSPPWTRSALCSGFHRRARREAWLPGSPPELPAPFQPPACCHVDDIPGTLDRTRRDLPRRRLRPLRSLLPPTKPYRAAAEAATRPLLPWACAPPEPSSDRASDPVTRWTIPSTAG